MKEIAIYGGSFDPPHIGHVLTIAHVLAMEPVHEVWVVPAFKHPLGKVAGAPYCDRVEMCHRAFEGSRVRVLAIESDLYTYGDPLSGRTHRTLTYLQSLSPPDHSFALVIGSDILRETEKWYRWGEVQKMARVIVIGRSSFPEGVPPGAVFLPNVSSTTVRAFLEAAPRFTDDVARTVPRAVLDYIKETGLYKAR